MTHTIHDEHTHTHGEGCGHVAFPHDDQTDYAPRWPHPPRA